MRVAADGTSPHDAESAAWMNTQLARYLWQRGATIEAYGALRIALDFQTNYAPALLLRGRMLLAGGKDAEAVESLSTAARLNPLPEYHWALAEALRTAHRDDEAHTAEMQIVFRGRATDPRTCSLYLATRRTNRDLAVRLARQELAEREDIFTHDALAWALAAAGKVDDAQSHLRLALGQGTQEARLFLHAAVITAQAGRLDEASSWLGRATALKFQLLPGENAELLSVEKLLSHSAAPRVAPTNGVAPKAFSTVASSGAEAEN
jgi:tetratricopeptide (TPR) repeat protein